MAATLSTSWAQLPNGSIAPDFTLTDINGQSHNLYSYLNEGKTVILDFSATWWSLLGPPSARHFEGPLQRFGPEGTDNLMVSSWSGSSTGLNELNGIGGSTYGDWVTGTPYPILDGQAVYDLSNTYQVPGYPTWYTVCPSGILTHLTGMDRVTTLFRNTYKLHSETVAMPSRVQYQQRHTLDRNSSIGDQDWQAEATDQPRPRRHHLGHVRSQLQRQHGNGHLQWHVELQWKRRCGLEPLGPSRAHSKRRWSP